MGVFPPPEVMRCVISACSPKDMPEITFLIWSYISISLRTFLVASVCYAIFWKDIPTFISLVGALVVALIGFLLKLIINHERMYPACGIGKGLPSIHTLLVWFLGVYYAISFAEFSEWPQFTLIVRTLFVFIYVMAVTVSRVKLRAADPLEAMVGALLGVLLGYAFFHLCSRISRSFIPAPEKKD